MMLREITKHACRPHSSPLDFGKGDERRRFRCDRGAACRVLAGAGMVGGATSDAEAESGRQLATGLAAAESDWRNASPNARQQKLAAWSKARQRAYPAVTWPDDETTARLRGSVTSDLSVLAIARAAGQRGKDRAAAEGETERLVRSLNPSGHQMGGGALLYLRRELDRLATARSALGQPVPQCPQCGQFISVKRSHECPASADAAVAAANAAGDYQPPPELADYYANLDDYGKRKLAEMRDYPGLGAMSRGEFAILAVSDQDASACYFSRDDTWAVLINDTAYPVGRAELAAFALLAAQRVTADAATSDEADRVARLAANPATPKGVWQELVEHPYPLVRAAIASRRDVDADTLTQLYNEALPVGELDEDDDGGMVRRLQNLTVRQEAIRNKNAPADLVQQAASDPDNGVRQGAAQGLQPALPQLPQWAAISVPHASPLSRYRQALAEVEDAAAVAANIETRLAAVQSDDADPILFAEAYADPEPTVRAAAHDRWVAAGADAGLLPFAARIIPTLPVSLLDRLTPPLRATAIRQAKAAVANGRYQRRQDLASEEVKRRIIPELRRDVADKDTRLAFIAFRELFHHSYDMAETEALQPVAHLAPAVRALVQPRARQEVVHDHFGGHYAEDAERNRVAASIIAGLTPARGQELPLNYLAAREYHRACDTEGEIFSQHWDYTVLRGEVKAMAERDAEANVKLNAETTMPLPKELASAAAAVAQRTRIPIAPPEVNRLAGVEAGLAYLCQYGKERGYLGAAISKSDLIAARNALLATLGFSECPHQEGVLRGDGACFETIFYVVDEW